MLIPRYNAALQGTTFQVSTEYELNIDSRLSGRVTTYPLRRRGALPAPYPAAVAPPEHVLAITSDDIPRWGHNLTFPLWYHNVFMPGQNALLNLAMDTLRSDSAPGPAPKVTDVVLPEAVGCTDEGERVRMVYVLVSLTVRFQQSSLPSQSTTKSGLTCSHTGSSCPRSCSSSSGMATKGSASLCSFIIPLSTLWPLHSDGWNRPGTCTLSPRLVIHSCRCRCLSVHAIFY